MISLPFPELVIERLGWTLVHSLWQFCAIAVLAAMLEQVLQRRSADLRYAALLAAFVIMAGSPLATWFWISNRAEPPVASPAFAAAFGGLPSPNVPPEPFAEPPQIPVGEGHDESGYAAAPAMPVPPATIKERIRAWRSAAVVRLRPWLSEVVAVWFLGAAMFSLRPLLSWRTIRRLRTTGIAPASPDVDALLSKTAGRLGLRRAVRICESSLVHAPMVLGYLRPLVLLPASAATGLSPSQLQAVLAHELAHIRRHDYLANLFQTVIETVFFYHPAVWWLSATIRHERENCCDDLAVAVAGDRVEFGKALLALEELRGAEPTLALAARGGSLLRRIRRLLDREPEAPASSTGAILGCGLLAAALVATLLWTESRAQAPRQNNQVAQKPAEPPPIAEKRPGAATNVPPQPARPHIFGHQRSAVGWQTDDKVYLVLYANGFLQTGLEETSFPTGEWSVRGHINLLQDRRVVRRFELRYSSDDLDTVYVDNKAYVMDAPPKDGAEGAMQTGRLIVLREKGEPLHTHRTLRLNSTKDLDPQQSGSLAALADMDLHLAETYRASRELAAQPGWVVAWDKHNPIQHGDGARIARLRIFPDGRVAVWEGLGKPLAETRIAREEVTELVNWLIDEQHAGARMPMNVVAEDGSKKQIFLDPLLGSLWDQEAQRVAAKRGEMIFDLLSVTPERPDRPEPALSKSAGALDKEVIDRLQQLVNVAAAAVPRAGENPAPEKPPEAANVDSPLVSGSVRDEATGESIPNVRVVAGVPFKGTNHATTVWQPHTIREFTGGSYAWSAQNAYDAMKLRIEAPGYETFTTDWLIKKNGPQTLDVTLKRDEGVEFTVVAPDGKPTAGAVVAIAMSNRTVRIKDKAIEGADQPRPEKPSEQWRRPDLGKTGADGKFTAPTERDPTAMLCIVHESGYFERPFGAYLAIAGKPLESRKIVLQPWGRIEGEVRWKDKPGANEIVEMVVMRDAADYPVIESAMIKLPCDEQGRFVVEGVTPGQVQIFHVSRSGDETPYFHAHVHPVVKGGETTRVVVGGRGRTVSGSLKGLTDYSGLTVRIAPNTPRPGDQDLMAAWSAFAQTEVGKLYFREPAAVKADGTFRLDSVLPGYYQVFIQNADNTIYHIERLSVPAESPDAAEPLDMGEIAIAPRAR
jgi:beta-lactamase regulating signal transducer with metallopeptidase domain